MNELFADSFFYLALLNRRDEHHARATDWARQNRRRLITTDWVLMEVGDAMAVSQRRAAFPRFVRTLRERREVDVVEFSRTMFERGLSLFEDRSDKQWSLTDCISFAVMEARGLTEALTGDRHFEQAGFIALVK